MGALQEFFIALGLDVDAASFASAQAIVDMLEKGLEKVVEWAGKAFSALENAVLGTAKYGSALDDASKKTGLATQELEQWSYIAELNGGSAESFQQALVHLSRRMTEARNGSKEALEAFARLGVHVTDGTGKLRSLDDVLGDVSNGLKATAGGAERIGAAVGVMGKGGADQIALLGQGAAELRRLREEHAATVGTLTAEQVQMLDTFDDSLTTLMAAGAQMVRQFAMPIVQALQPIVDRLLAWRRANKDVIDAKLAEWGEKVASAITKVGDAAMYLVAHFNEVVTALQFVALALGSIGTAIFLTSLPALGALTLEFAAMAAAAISAALSAAAAWIAAALPIAAIALVVAGLYLAFDDLFTFLTGGESIIGHILDNYWTQIEAFLTMVRTAIHALGFGPELEKALGLANKFGLAVGDAVAPQGPEAAADAHPYAGLNFSREFAPRVSDFVSAPTSVSSSSSSVRSSTHVSAPFTVNVTAAPGQSSTEVAGEAVRQIREYLDGELIKAQHGKD